MSRAKNMKKTRETRAASRESEDLAWQVSEEETRQREEAVRRQQEEAQQERERRRRARQAEEAAFEEMRSAEEGKSPTGTAKVRSHMLRC